jgi:hypothetical protein
MSREFKIFCILGCCFFLFIAAAIVKSPTSRSTQQVVIHNNNISLLTKQINEYYTKGYKVVVMESQNISIATGSVGYTERNSGEIVVIMEK